MLGTSPSAPAAGAGARRSRAPLLPAPPGPGAPGRVPGSAFPQDSAGEFVGEAAIGCAGAPNRWLDN